jgi:hypothetical protein
MSQQQASPFKLLWENRYPFQYWQNRLEKINPYNDYDKLEALWSLVQLSDIYAHVFAAYARNPEMPWFFIKENTFRGDIDDVLDALRTEGIATVGGLSENPNGLASVETSDEYDLSEMDAIAGAFLGCPHTIDTETKRVEFDEEPDLHRGVCNAILKFADDHTPLLNDFKHGFRVLPVTPDDVERVIRESAVVSEEDEEQFELILGQLREALEEDSWGFCFVRMHTEAADYGRDVHLDLYQVDAWPCYKFAELTLYALNNLISQHDQIGLEEKLGEVPIPVLEGEESIMNHVFGFVTPVRDDPDRILSEDEFNPNSG